MGRHAGIKILAMVLTVVAITALVASTAGILVLSEQGLYSQTPEGLLNQRWRNWAIRCGEDVTDYVVTRYNTIHLGSAPEELLNDWRLYDNYGTATWLLEEGYAYYTIADESGRVLESTYEEQEKTEEDMSVIHSTETYNMVYPVAVKAENENSAGLTEEETDSAMTPDAIIPPTAGPVAAEDFEYRYDSWWEGSDGQLYHVYYRESPVYMVTVYITAEARDENGYGYFFDTGEWTLLNLLYTYRFELIGIFAAAALLSVAGVIYLGWAAGRKPGEEEARAAGLNRMPLDLYAGLAVAGVVGVGYLTIQLCVYSLEDGQINPGTTAICMAGALVCVLLVTAFYYALAAQLKVAGGYWWRHTVIGWCLIHLFRLVAAVLRWLWKTVPSFCVKVWRGLASVWSRFWGWIKRMVLFLRGKLRGLFRWCRRKMTGFFQWLGGQFVRFYELLPLTWQWLLTGAVLLLAVLLAALSRNGTVILVVLAAGLGVVLYGAHAYGILMEATRRMGQGDLDTKVSDQFLIGGFKDFAGDLNALADVAVESAKQQMKSERMKSELITNVSHDIKTPLTSIINYIDLLQKPHTPEEEEQYLEVLNRQAQRLKKLIVDLIEMSKASTGNMPVEITQVDAVEAVNQALGEYADRLAAAQLTPVFRMPEEPVTMLADGRLVWRVLSNLMGNAVKYALPGTRVYIDVMSRDGKVSISMKNISREELNVSADELMERFVRGDASRNTEGSGLGLNIAKSLMELQHGQLQLLVDGDLFKATLVFPAGNCS